MALPSVLVIARSAVGLGVSVSVAELLAGFGSVTPAGTATVAVLTRLPVAVEGAVPITVKITELPAPAATFRVAARLLPDPVAPAVTVAVPVVLEVQVTPVSVAGTLSATVAAVTLLRPLLVTVIV